MRTCGCVGAEAGMCVGRGVCARGCVDECAEGMYPGAFGRVGEDVADAQDLLGGDVDGCNTAAEVLPRNICKARLREVFSEVLLLGKGTDGVH